MILYGASGHAKVIIDTLEAFGIQIDYVVDDDASITSLLGYEVRRDSSHYNSAIVSIGDGRIRKEIVSRLEVKEWVKAIHPKATVSPHTTIGEGSWIGVGSCVKQGVKIGQWVTIGAGSGVVKDIPYSVTAYGCPCCVKDTNDNNMIKNELRPLGGERIAFTIERNEERRMSHAA